MLPALRRISSAAHTNAAKYEPRVLPLPRGGFHPLRELVLPIPQPLTPRLVALGVDELPAQRISSAVIEAIKLLKRSCEDGFQQRRLLLQTRLRYISDAKFSSMVPATYANLYMQTVDRWTSYLLEDVAPRILAVQNRARQTPLAASHKRPFNQAAIPMLESFFDKNAFPSRLEKVELASECRMDYRQIHVWFQNRRSRLRKDGKTLKKRDSSVPGLEKLEDTIVGTLLPETNIDDEAQPNSVVDDLPPASVCSPAADELFLSDEPPAHAFPSPYPPICAYEPFPTDPSRRAFDLPWAHVPCSQPPSRTDSDVSTLISAFSAMSLIGKATSSDDRVGQERPAHSLHSSSMFLFGFATVCPPAPLPALVNKGSCSSRANVRLPSLPAPHLSSNDSLLGRRILSPIQKRYPAAPYGLYLAAQSTGRGAKRSLPRRSPKNPPIGCTTRTTSPVAFNVATRLSSTSSVASEFSGSGSDCDSPPHTPVFPSARLSSPAVSCSETESIFDLPSLYRYLSGGDASLPTSKTPLLDETALIPPLTAPPLYV